MYLGTFNVTSGKLRVTDPCYDKDTWCAGTIDVVNGQWSAFVQMSDEGAWGKRVAELHVFKDNVTATKFWEKTDIDVGVDSGQAGFFDESFFPEDDTKEAFYDNVCNITLSRDQAGTIEFGAVSSSGYGDGGYTCYVARNDANEIVAAKIIFISDEEYDEEEDDEL